MGGVPDWSHVKHVSGIYVGHTKSPWLGAGCPRVTPSNIYVSYLSFHVFAACEL